MDRSCNLHSQMLLIHPERSYWEVGTCVQYDIRSSRNTSSFCMGHHSKTCNALWQCFSAFQEQSRKKSFFSGNTDCASAAGELLQQSIVPCSPAQGVRAKTSRIRINHCSNLNYYMINMISDRYVHRNSHTSSPCLHPGTHAKMLMPLHIQGSVSPSLSQQSYKQGIAQGKTGRGYNSRTVHKKSNQRLYPGKWGLQGKRNNMCKNSLCY